MKRRRGEAEKGRRGEGAKRRKGERATARGHEGTTELKKQTVFRTSYMLYSKFRTKHHFFGKFTDPLVKTKNTDIKKAAISATFFMSVF
ncbi:MAG: hypothetical protein WCJ95_04790 [Mariniphaga sp.]